MKQTLATMLKDPDRAQKIATQVGCSIHHLRNIRDGRRTPSLRLTQRLMAVTKLSMDAFLPQER